jgi:hypothetical protein
MIPAQCSDTQVIGLVRIFPVMASDHGSPALRLLLIPFLVYLVWLTGIYLLVGNNRLLEHPEPVGIALYTVIVCILTGMIIPVICIRKAFITGAVNMFQIGFRTRHRTILACSVTCAIGLGIILLASPFGTDRFAFANAFLLLLPTAAASVMVCWVLAGTHVQAFVRSGGAVRSIVTGVVVTGLLFASATLAGSPSLWPDGAFFWLVGIGMGSALFYFAVRDVYATVILVAGSGVFARAGMFDSGYLHGIHPGIYASTLLAVLVLLALHLHLSRNYATIMVPAERSSAAAGEQTGPE